MNYNVTQFPCIRIFNGICLIFSGSKCAINAVLLCFAIRHYMKYMIADQINRYWAEYYNVILQLLQSRVQTLLLHNLVYNIDYCDRNHTQN